MYLSYIFKMKRIAPFLLIGLIIFLAGCSQNKTEGKFKKLLSECAKQEQRDMIASSSDFVVQLQKYLPGTAPLVVMATNKRTIIAYENAGYVAAREEICKTDIKDTVKLDRLVKK